MCKQYYIGSVGNQTLAYAFKNAVTDDYKIAARWGQKRHNTSTNSAEDGKNCFTQGRIMF